MRRTCEKGSILANHCRCQLSFRHITLTPCPSVSLCLFENCAVRIGTPPRPSTAIRGAKIHHGVEREPVELSIGMRLLKCP